MIFYEEFCGPISLQGPDTVTKFVSEMQEEEAEEEANYNPARNVANGLIGYHLDDSPTHEFSETDQRREHCNFNDQDKPFAIAFGPLNPLPHSLNDFRVRQWFVC